MSSLNGCCLYDATPWQHAVLWMDDDLMKSSFVEKISLMSVLICGSMNLGDNLYEVPLCSLTNQLIA